MLRACARLLRPGGRTAFYTIHLAEGLTAVQRRRGSRHGPPAVACKQHRDLLSRAGFTDVTETDCTSEFIEATNGWIDQWDLHRAEVEAIYGEAVVAQRQRGRRAYLRVVEAGILRRSLLTATRP